MIDAITKAREQPPSEEFLWFSYEGADVRFDIYLQVFTLHIFTKIGIQAWIRCDGSVFPARVGRSIDLDTSGYLREGASLEESISRQMIPMLNAMWRDLIYALPPEYQPRKIPRFLWAI